MVALPRTFTSTVTEETLKDQARLLAALADPRRLLILNLLVQHGSDINVGEITECLGIEQPTTSHHLRILLNVKLIDYHKSGLYSYYHIRPETLYQVMGIVDALIPMQDALSVAG